MAPKGADFVAGATGFEPTSPSPYDGFDAVGRLTDDRGSCRVTRRVATCFSRADGASQGCRS